MWSEGICVKRGKFGKLVEVELLYLHVNDGYALATVLNIWLAKVGIISWCVRLRRARRLSSYWLLNFGYLWSRLLPWQTRHWLIV